MDRDEEGIEIAVERAKRCDLRLPVEWVCSVGFEIGVPFACGLDGLCVVDVCVLFLVGGAAEAFACHLAVLRAVCIDGIHKGREGGLRFVMDLLNGYDVIGLDDVCEDRHDLGLACL